MQEIHRQEYLYSLGIENYAPRWVMPFAAESYLCDQSYESIDDIQVSPSLEIDLLSDQQYSNSSMVDLNQILNGVEKTSVKVPSRIDDILQQFENKTSQTIQSFSLSVWRPTVDFIIVATRNANAMPTELFLNNFLRFYLQQPQFSLKEEVLRWPAIENKKMTLTERDASAELQTWLSVQNEFQPIKTLWFFGDACRYFVTETLPSSDRFEIGFCEIKMDSSQIIRAKIFPDLGEFLLQSQLKIKLMSLA